MKKVMGILIVVIVFGVIGFFSASRYLGQYRHMQEHAAKTKGDVYYCPMHPSYTSDKPGECPICGMALVKKDKTPANDPAPVSGEKKVLYYRNPMNPEVRSPGPMKDSMGMDYVPVYKEEGASGKTGITMSQEKQQLIGVKKEKIEKRHLAREIRSVGKVAYDPGLYVAQTEYLQAQKTKETTKDSSLAPVKEQMQALLDAAEQKLILMGMAKGEIQELAKQGQPQQNLYLPLESKTVWVYASIYEYEVGEVKEGLSVAVDAVAFPGEVFKGTVMHLF